MPAPTNPKKRSLMPSGKLRRELRAHGHALSALVQVGKAGVTPALLKQVHQALADHELVKVKVGGESPEDRVEVAAALAAEPGVSVVQVLGRIVLVYKRHPHLPRFEGRRAQQDAPDAAAQPPARKRPSARAAAEPRASRARGPRAATDRRR